MPAKTCRHPDAADLTITHVLHALSDPTRLEAVRTLDRLGEKRCGECGGSVAKSTMTHHLRVLREAGLVRVRPDGPSLLLSVRRADLDARFPGLLDAVLNAPADSPADGAARADCGAAA